MGLKEMCEGVNWIILAQERAFMDMVIKSKAV
jgi:hypothetical protein